MMRYVNPNHPAGFLYPQESFFTGGARRGRTPVSLTPEERDPLGAGVEARRREDARRLMTETVMDDLSLPVLLPTGAVLIPANVTRYLKRKLDVESVRAIRALVAAGQPRAAIALQFGVSRMTIWQVVVGERWAAA